MYKVQFIPKELTTFFYWVPFFQWQTPAVTKMADVATSASRAANGVAPVTAAATALHATKSTRERGRIVTFSLMTIGDVYIQP